MNTRTNYKATLVNVTTSETELLAFDADRSPVILHNQDSSTDVKVYVDSASTAYITLAAGETLHFPVPPMNQLNAVVDSGSANVTVMVG